MSKSVTRKSYGNLDPKELAVHVVLLTIWREGGGALVEWLEPPPPATLLIVSIFWKSSQMLDQLEAHTHVQNLLASIIRMIYRRVKINPKVYTLVNVVFHFGRRKAR